MLFKSGFNKDFVINNLNSQYIGKNIIYTKKTQSTNDLAKDNKNMPCGTVFIADKQTMARGRNSRKWVSDTNKGLWFSVLLKPRNSVFEIPNLTLVAGLCVVKVLNEMFCEKFMIKSQNDIVSGTKKVSGILCESTKDNENNIIILGIGLNLNQKRFKKEISGIATSVYRETGKKIKREEFLLKFLELFEKMYENTLKTGFLTYLEEYKKYSVTVGKDVYLLNGDEKKEAYALDINGNGELIVSVDGEIKNIVVGDISVRGIY